MDIAVLFEFGKPHYRQDNHFSYISTQAMRVLTPLALTSPVSPYHPWVSPDLTRGKPQPFGITTWCNKFLGN